MRLAAVILPIKMSAFVSNLDKNKKFLITSMSNFPLHRHTHVILDVPERKLGT
jgi:hypothetical protein